jgi:regulation of enolase protein 1 (concanavalin A-like superfamily)
VIGWDKPVDPMGDCRFERKGDRLSITVPGTPEHHFIFGREEPLHAPRLLRRVEGDFAVEVRVRGSFGKAGMSVGYRRAGLLLVDDRCDPSVKVEVALARFVHGGEEALPPVRFQTEVRYPGGGEEVEGDPEPQPVRPVHLRLERLGDTCRLSCSVDGHTWAPLHDLQLKGLPRKVIVGVVAEATASGTFKAVFDQFRLTPLASKSGR